MEVGLRMTNLCGLFLRKQPLHIVILYLHFKQKKIPPNHEEASKVYPILWTEKR